MHPKLLEAATALGVELPALEAAARESQERISAARDAVRAFLGTEGDGNGPLILAFGSMARLEMTAGSDFDFLVVLNGLETDPGRIQRHRRAALEALHAIAAQPPGSTGLFGVVISGTDLVNTIGLDGDTNLHLSRRILFLEESIALNRQEERTRLLQLVCARYLHDANHAVPHVPRFLLNDVVRYWRTIAVDYEAKRWEREGQDGWGLRYAKLLSSRKLTYAAAVIATFAPRLYGQACTADKLAAEFDTPALARLASIHQAVPESARNALRDVLSIADEFHAFLASSEHRERLKRIESPSEAGASEEMERVRQLATLLDVALGEFFFDESSVEGTATSMNSLTRRYMVF